ncbi:hypothetical protein Tco_0020442 [Tanacetum coccineum]
MGNNSLWQLPRRRPQYLVENKKRRSDNSEVGYDVLAFEGSNLWVLGLQGHALGIRSLWNSTWRTRGSPGRSLGKTFGNSLTTGISSSLFLSDFFSITWIRKT